jgi:hypothetical protein
MWLKLHKYSQLGASTERGAAQRWDHNLSRLILRLSVGGAVLPPIM